MCPEVVPTTQTARNATAVLRQVASSLQSGRNSRTVTVREFLGWFGAYKRSYTSVQRIRATLRRTGLRTEPDFETTYIDSQIVFALADTGSSLMAVPRERSATYDGDTESVVVSAGIGDPTYRIGMLAAANQGVTAVRPDDSVSSAVTQMLALDYSQLPVMTDERTVKGMISWKSIAARWALGRQHETVRLLMDEACDIAAERSLFSAIGPIVENGYVLIRDASRKITGIITTADLSIQFQQLTEPFLLLREIENNIRRVIDGHFTKHQLALARDPSGTSREIGSVTDLTFGEYGRLLQDKSNWEQCGLPIDRRVFLRLLDNIRIIRNDVMHFDPDPLPERDLQALRHFAQFVQSVHILTK